MTGELLSILFGPFLLSNIGVAVVGYFIGSYVTSFGARVVIWIAAAISITGMVAVSGTMHSYGRIADARLISESDLDFLFLGSAGGIIAFYTLAQMFGSVVLNYSVEEGIEEIEELSDDRLLELVEVFLSQPDISSTAWVSNRWFIFSTIEKQKWVVLHSEKIRSFLIDQGGVNYFDHEQFFMELQRIDRNPSEISLNN